MAGEPWTLLRPTPAPGTPVPTLGVEEEFFLVRPDGRVADLAPELIAAAPPEVRATTEFTRCQIETSTGVCEHLTDVGRELSVARRVLAQAAADRRARLVAVGTPPVDVPGFALLSDDERYRRLVTETRGVTEDVVTCAAQVHVEVPGRDLGVAVLARLRPWLPVLMALGGNSPIRQGRDTGWASSRFVSQRLWPSFRPPPVCADAAAYGRLVDDLVAGGQAIDERGVYFWARVSTRYPTVEVRLPDTGLTVADAVLQAGLGRAAVMTALADEAAGRPVPAVPDRMLLAAAYAAARRGLAAAVVDPVDGGWAPATAVLRQMLTSFAPALEAAGDRRLVRTLLVLRLRRGSGADRQRALWHRGPRASFVQALANLSAGLDT
ncbi:YbdK family carboxylate-amine ligase [Blastococcus sp. SYSU D00922]